MRQIVILNRFEAPPYKGLEYVLRLPVPAGLEDQYKRERSILADATAQEHNEVSRGVVFEKQEKQQWLIVPEAGDPAVTEDDMLEAIAATHAARQDIFETQPTVKPISGKHFVDGRWN